MNRTWMPEITGILNIVAGVLSLLGSFFIALVGIVILFSPNWYWDGNIIFPAAVVWLIFLPYFIISVVAIVGGIYALKRRLWGLALAGSICSVLTIWAWMLGVAAIVLVINAKREFDNAVPLPTTIIPPSIPPPSPPPQP